jgi:hypothetical protein
MNSLTLESAEAAFQQWREQRSSRSELIPKNLWSMALKLYPQYKRSIICRRLGLSGGQFKQHLDDNSPTFSDSGFVLASRDSVKENSMLKSKVQLTIQGKERALTFSVDVHALGQILPHIGMLL